MKRPKHRRRMKEKVNEIAAWEPKVQVRVAQIIQERPAGGEDQPRLWKAKGSYEGVVC